MNLNVKLYGTLSRLLDDYNHQEGLDVTIPEDTSIQDLLVHLNLEPDGIGMIFMDGMPAKKKARLKQGARITIFQPIFGG